MEHYLIFNQEISDKKHWKDPKIFKKSKVFALKCLNKLFEDHPYILDELEIDIVFTDSHHLGDLDGDCQDQEDDYFLFSRVFTVYVDAKIQDFQEVLKVIAHELIHVYQMAIGKLRDVYVKNDLHSWSWDEKSYSLKTQYVDRPWEIEAFEREVELYNACS